MATGQAKRKATASGRKQSQSKKIPRRDIEQAAVALFIEASAHHNKWRFVDFDQLNQARADALELLCEAALAELLMLVTASPKDDPAVVITGAFSVRGRWQFTIAEYAAAQLLGNGIAANVTVQSPIAFMVGANTKKTFELIRQSEQPFHYIDRAHKEPDHRAQRILYHPGLISDMPFDDATPEQVAEKMRETRRPPAGGVILGMWPAVAPSAIRSRKRGKSQKTLQIEQMIRDRKPDQEIVEQKRISAVNLRTIKSRMKVKT
jgi:hypothetical protein